MYIDFIIKDEAKYNDMKNVYYLIAEAKRSGEFNNEEFWINVFPDYSLNKFYFFEAEGIPKNYSPDKPICLFYDMLNLILFYLDVELNECKRIQDNGRIEFEPRGFPYGTIGLNGLIRFLYAFDCKTFEIDQGGYVNVVYWFLDYRYIWDKKMESGLNTSEMLSLISNESILLYRPLTIAYDQVVDAFNRVGSVKLTSGEPNLIQGMIRYKFQLIPVDIELYDVEHDKTYLQIGIPDEAVKPNIVTNVTERLVNTILKMDDSNYKPDRLGINLSSIIIWVIFLTGLILLIIKFIL